MSDEPRAEERTATESQWLAPGVRRPSMLGERMRLALSPADDELPIGQAIRRKEELEERKR